MGVEEFGMQLPKRPVQGAFLALKPLEKRHHCVITRVLIRNF